MSNNTIKEQMRYFVTGRTIPERAAITVINMPTKELEGIGELTFNCDASYFSVIIDKTELDVQSAFLFAKEYASIIIGSLGYANGCGYSVEAIQVQTENNQSYIFGVQNPELAHTDSNAILNEVLNLSLKDIYLRFAIRDYVSAIVSEIECAFLCYRAIETIKSNFESQFPHQGWKKMHELIGSNEEDIKYKIKSFADPIRHGAYHEFRTTNSMDRTNILKQTKEIINLYKQYLLTSAI